jgi:hypothetical protein
VSLTERSESTPRKSQAKVAARNGTHYVATGSLEGEQRRFNPALEWGTLTEPRGTKVEWPVIQFSSSSCMRRLALVAAAKVSKG